MAGVRPFLGRLYWQGTSFPSPVFKNCYHRSCAAFGRFGKARPPVAQKHLFLKDEDARDFIYTLKASERSILLSQLTKFEEERLKTLQTERTELTSSQIKLLFVHNALPFVGFGFLDNVLMIVAGEYIDSTFGALLGISTMAAAGLGNMVSDIAGIGSAWYVEMLAGKLGFHSPPLTAQQVDMPKTRWIANLGKVIGISIGCILGMFPLLFFNKENTEESTEAEKKDNTEKKS